MLEIAAIRSGAATKREAPARSIGDARQRSSFAPVSAYSIYALLQLPAMIQQFIERFGFFK